MKNTGRRFFALLCVFCLSLGAGRGAKAAEPDTLSFCEDGDVVGFIGDSITHAEYTQVNYLVALGQYYSGRFPDRKVEFRNLSASGYKAVDVLDIYDMDPAFRGLDKAVIMLGTNEAILGFSPEQYIGDMEKLVRRLKEDGLDGGDILVISPPVCDENCAKNYDGNGRQRWTYEGRVKEYMAALEEKTEEWGVHYLDIHTPMLELTDKMQREDSWNTLTTDCIHPNTTGQIWIAYSILKAQGAETLSIEEMTAPRDGEMRAAHGEAADFYRGEKGMCWTWTPETLPVELTGELQAFREFARDWGIADAASFCGEMLRVEGLSPEGVYHVYMGEADLGGFTGEELEKGIDLGASTAHPLQDSMRQIEERNRERHKIADNYRDVWVAYAMGWEEYTSGQIQAEYEAWRDRDEKLREEIRALAEEASGQSFRMYVAEEGCSVEELEQEARTAKKEAEEQARREEEEARKAAEEEQRKREEEERARREAEEQASLEAWNREQEQLEEAEKTEEQTRLYRGVGIGGGACLLAVLLVQAGFRIKKKKAGGGIR